MSGSSKHTAAKADSIWKTVKSLARSSDADDNDRLGEHDSLSSFGLRRGLSNDGLRGFMEFALSSPYLTVMRSAFTASQDQVSIATSERDVLRIRLGLSGALEYIDRDGSRSSVDEPSCLLVTQPRKTELETTVLAFEHYRFVGFIIPRGVLVDVWGFDPSLLPELLQRFERGEVDVMDVHHLEMGSELISIATDILKCPFQGALLDQFLESKAKEAICYLISNLGHAEEKSVAALEDLRLTDRDRQCLAQARNIIDLEYASPPPIKTLARIVGLNRNKLCSGFRAAYGLSVHEYARELKLQKALELLRGGKVSITEVSETVGYGHSSSLTAAIKRRFGVSPRQLRG